MNIFFGDLTTYKAKVVACNLEAKIYIMKYRCIN